MGFLQSAAWLKARRKALHVAQWRCQRCGASVTGSRQSQVHHKKPRDGAPALLLEPMNLEVLCRRCHRGAHSRGEELAPHAEMACDENGNPTDAWHPWNADRGDIRKIKVVCPSAARLKYV